MLRFILYALRWQLSTPILWPVIHYMGTGIWPVVLANFIGAGIFFFVDKFIFGPRIQEWEFLQWGECVDCGHVGALRRLRYDPRGYDKREDPNPEFRCSDCSKRKLKSLDLDISAPRRKEHGEEQA